MSEEGRGSVVGGRVSLARVELLSDSTTTVTHVSYEA